ncbi:uncharacterized protein LOC141910168 [Tubulanus polymorphus]|uniref:uncharacterized protein LOC141910168 n=1 Tax=Tubulanus polymorphus TaxID=672921 RepID=UPI003DA2CCED
MSTEVFSEKSGACAVVVKQEPIDDFPATAPTNSSVAKVPRIVHQRKMNFTPNEVSELIGLIQKYKESLFGPYPFRIKRECWYRIANELADVEGGTERSPEEVKKKWENLQHDTKSKIAMFQKCNGKIPNINWTENNDVVLEIIESRNLLSMSAPSVAQMTKISEQQTTGKRGLAEDGVTTVEGTEYPPEKRKKSTETSQQTISSTSSTLTPSSSVTLTIPTLPASMLSGAADTSTGQTTVKYCNRAFVSGACAQTIVQSSASDQYNNNNNNSTTSTHSNIGQNLSSLLFNSNAAKQPLLSNRRLSAAVTSLTGNNRPKRSVPHELDSGFNTERLMFSEAQNGIQPNGEISPMASPLSSSPRSVTNSSAADLCVIGAENDFSQRDLNPNFNNHSNNDFLKLRSSEMNVPSPGGDAGRPAMDAEEREIRLDVLKLEKQAWQLKIDLLEEKLKYQRRLNEKLLAE